MEVETNSVSVGAHSPAEFGPAERETAEPAHQKLPTVADYTRARTQCEAIRRAFDQIRNLIGDARLESQFAITHLESAERWACVSSYRAYGLECDDFFIVRKKP